MAHVNLDIEDHIYFTEDFNIVPGVTEILQAVGIINKQWFADQARIRGSYVHKATALWDDGCLREDTLDPILIPYLEAWKRFRRETSFQPELIEHPVYSQRYGYAGTLDRWGSWPGHGKTLLDIKTGYAPRWAELQLAAYEAALPRYTDGGRVTIHLKNNGRYNIIENDDDDALPNFLYALKVYKYINPQIHKYERKEK